MVQEQEVPYMALDSTLEQADGKMKNKTKHIMTIKKKLDQSGLHDCEQPFAHRPIIDVKIVYKTRFGQYCLLLYNCCTASLMCMPGTVLYTHNTITTCLFVHACILSPTNSQAYCCWLWRLHSAVLPQLLHRACQYTCSYQLPPLL